MNTNTTANTGSINFGETVSVPLNYITGTLCRDGKYLFGNLPPFANSRTGKGTGTGTGTEKGTGAPTVGIYKGILYYTLCKMGELSIEMYVKNMNAITKNEATSIPMTFLPSTVVAEWRNTIESYIPGNGTTTMSEIMTTFRTFLIRTLNGNNLFRPVTATTGTTTDANVADVSKGVLIYTLYNEGKYLFCSHCTDGHRVSTAEITKTPVDFLPADLQNNWVNTVSRASFKGTSVEVDDVLTMWKNFLTNSVYKCSTNVIQSIAA